MPEGPWLYPADQTADVPMRVLLAAEITREKLYLRVHQELPYAAAVDTTSFKELKDGSGPHRDERYMSNATASAPSCSARTARRSNG